MHPAQTKTLEYIRKGHIIRDVSGTIVFEGYAGSGEHRVPSINAAKRESRKLQGSALGLGSLRVD